MIHSLSFKIPAGQSTKANKKDRQHGKKSGNEHPTETGSINPEKAGQGKGFTGYLRLSDNGSLSAPCPIFLSYSILSVSTGGGLYGGSGTLRLPPSRCSPTFLLVRCRLSYC